MTIPKMRRTVAAGTMNARSLLGIPAGSRRAYATASSRTTKRSASRGCSLSPAMKPRRTLLALSVVLLRRPDQVAAIREDPELIRPAMEELLRYLTNTQGPMARLTVEPREMRG
jgi:hypothetical protein